MQNQINTSPLSMFVQQVRSAEMTGSKQVSMDIAKARLLALALTELLDKVNRDYESMFNELKKSTSPDVITVELDGGGFSKE
jgi:hypothetical protein